MFDRYAAIDELINDDMNTVQNDDGWYLSRLLSGGFKGYVNYTDDELIEEIKERAIGGFGV